MAPRAPFRMIRPMVYRFRHTSHPVLGFLVCHMNARQAAIARRQIDPTPNGANFIPTDAGEVYSGLAKSTRNAARLKAAYVAKTKNNPETMKIEFTTTIWQRMSLRQRRKPQSDTLISSLEILRSRTQRSTAKLVSVPTVRRQSLLSLPVV